MLQKLNERIQGMVAWVIIVLVTITFMLFGIDYYLQSRHESTAQVAVNGEPITKQALELSYRRIRQFRGGSVQLDAMRENQLKQQVLNDMIMNTLSIQSAHANGFEVSPSQANAAILSIPQFQQDGRFSTNRYAQALNNAFFTPASFQKEVRQGMLLNQQRFAMIGTSFALPTELKEYVRLYMQTRDYEYLKIPAMRFLNHAHVSDEEVNAYYQAHKRIFLTPEKVSLDYIQLSMRQIRESIDVSPIEIRRYYDENQTNYLTPAQWQVEQIRFPIPADASADGLAELQNQVAKASKKLKQSPSAFATEAFQGSVRQAATWVTPNQADFNKVLATLTQPGQLSSPVQTKTAYVIYKVLAYHPATPKSFDAVQEEIKQQILNERAQTKYTQSLEQLTELSYQTPDSLTPVAKALNLPIAHTDFFSRHGGEQPITKDPNVIRAAFSRDVLKFGNNSEPVQFDNDSVIVLRIRKHLPATEKTLVDVKSLIVEKLAKKKAAAEAKQFGQELLAKKQNPNALDKVMGSDQLKWQDVTNAGRETDQVPLPVNEMAFNLPSVGERNGLELTDGDFVIVSLKKINDGRFELLDKEQVSSLRQQIEANYGLMDYDLYVHGLMNQAKIVKH